MIDFEIKESDRTVPFIFFFLGSIIGMYIAKLLYDESFRYFHYIMIPDFIYQFDRMTDKGREYRDSNVEYYHLPSEPSSEAVNQFFYRLLEIRNEHKQKKSEERKRKSLEDLEKSLDSDIYLLSIEGENVDSLKEQKEIILERVRKMG